jgi:hypothetical protein
MRERARARERKRERASERARERTREREKVCVMYREGISRKVLGSGRSPLTMDKQTKNRMGEGREEGECGARGSGMRMRGRRWRMIDNERQT